MLKKSIITLILVGFTGALIWGGINRTQAKAGENEGRGAETSANGKQNRAEEHDHEDCDEDGYQNEINADMADSLNQGQSTGNGARVQGKGEGGRGNGGQQGQGNGRSEPLDVTEIEALYMALDDEYHALAVYQSVIETFGEVEPFVEIAASEQRHIGALINQLNKNGLTIPENPWIGNVPTFDSIQQACQTGVQAEIDNAALYDQLFNMTDDPALIRVFTNLSNASLTSHLPQFEACQ
jgi:hypothetical protein